ncbi:hypothetical protein V1515DRAFT_587672 [Lipomyces mesembrius]
MDIALAIKNDMKKCKTYYAFMDEIDTHYTALYAGGLILEAIRLELHREYNYYCNDDLLDSNYPEPSHRPSIPDHQIVPYSQPPSSAETDTIVLAQPSSTATDAIVLASPTHS